MTYEEALNFNQKWTAEQAKNDLERYLLRDERPAYKAVALGMQALEKQIPKKVTEKKFPDNPEGDRVPMDIKLHYCPCCNVRFIGWGMKYCGECGQALDWSDSE